MAEDVLLIKDVAVATEARLDDAIPASRPGSGQPVVITPALILGLTPFLAHVSVDQNTGLPLWDGGPWPGSGSAPSAPALLLENGGYLLLENGSRLLLE